MHNQQNISHSGVLHNQTKSQLFATTQRYNNTFRDNSFLRFELKNRANYISRRKSNFYFVYHFYIERLHIF
jgi:hypothetical protein